MTNPVAAIYFVLIALLAGGINGYFVGYRQGVAHERAKQSAQSIADLTHIIDASNSLINDSNAASKRMREALTQRATQDTNTTREIRNVLAKTAGSRVDCRFDDGVMRSLSAARSRAAAAAAGGVRNTLPGPGATGE